MTEGARLAGVIGHPIKQSKSPVLHGHWLNRYEINGHYIPMDVAPDDLATVLAALPKMGFRGINVTVPHKERALDLSHSVTDRAALIGAANTLTFLKDGRIQADNTDGIGFLANVEQYAPQFQASSGPAVVLGAGGAARGIISALLEAGAPKVRLTNRTRSRADVLRAHFGARVEVVDWAKASGVLGDAALLVNTTSLGMLDNPELRLSLDGLNPQAVVTDIVYNPLRTDLLRRAEAMGCVTVDGLGMLLHQAVPGFHRWFGRKPEVDEDLRRAVLGA